MSILSFSFPNSGIERRLEPELCRWLGREVRVAAVRRKPYPYSSSHALESLDVELADGRTVALLLKSAEQGAGERRSVRPSFIDDPRREVEIYREILEPCGVSAPGYICTLAAPASSANTGSGTTWLVLERVKGLELYQSGDFEVWLEAARWLARLHAPFTDHRHGATAGARELICLGRATRLLIRDAAFHRRWWQRAGDMIGARADGDAEAALASVRQRFEIAVERSTALPTTFIHGEFYASNILVKTGPTGPEICPVDWEMASLGPGLLDLAALTSGRWEEAERDAMAEAYRGALPADLRSPPPEFREALADCRILLAVQWLGWAADWTPPPEQAHDWLAELLSMATPS